MLEAQQRNKVRGNLNQVDLAATTARKPASQRGITGTAETEADKGQPESAEGKARKVRKPAW
jgi:hypothetical protein